jgi:hypothetical protein
MTTQSLILAAIATFLTEALLPAQVTHKMPVSQTVMEFYFDSDSAAPCKLQITSAFRFVTVSRLNVLCGKQKIYDLEINGGFVDMARADSGSEKVFLRWEAGTSQERVTVISLKNDSKGERQTQLVLDVASEFTPDISFRPDMVLVGRGKVFADTGEMFPESSDVFNWDGNRYVLLRNCKWRTAESYSSRLAHLATFENGCP